MRERLIGLLRDTFNYTKGVCIDFDEAVEINADHLLANGVVIIDPQKYPPVNNQRIIKTVLGVSLDEMAELIDAKQEGRIIVPPCKVGDIVYITLHPYTFLPLKKAVEGEVMSLKIWEGGLSVTVLFDTKKINGCADYAEWTWGERLFFTREEAEKALKEAKG